MRPIIAMLTLALLVRAQPATETTALTHATVIDGTGSPSLTDTTVVVQGSRITAVYPAASRPPPA